jgi:ribosomal protein L15
MTATREKKSRYKMGKNRRLGKRRRGQGNRGGTGNAGGGKRNSQKLDLIISIRGKVGKKITLKPKKREAAINIDDLNTLILKKAIKPKSDTVNINLEEFGFRKLLSRGKPAFKYEITCGAASANAKEKIKKAGGKIILPEAEEEVKEKKPKKEESKEEEVEEDEESEEDEEK